MSSGTEQWQKIKSKLGNATTAVKALSDLLDANEREAKRMKRQAKRKRAKLRKRGRRLVQDWCN